MIDFRYHVVSIIAIFIALAVGILLGSGPLKDPIDATIQQQAEELRTDRNALREEVTEGQAESDYYAAFTDALAPTLIDGRLSGRSVVLVDQPGVDETLTDAVRATLTSAGATVTGTVTLDETYLDPASDPQLDEVATELVAPGTTFDETDDARRRASTVLARALVTNDPDLVGEPDEDATALLTALADLDYLSFGESTPPRAGLALLLAPPAPETPDEGSDASTGAVVALAAALDRQDLGTLVAGPIEATGEGGVLRRVREDADLSAVISTVDSVQTAAGRVTTVLGLVAESRGEVAAYGYGPEADVVLPDLAARQATPAPAAGPSPTPPPDS